MSVLLSLLFIVLLGFAGVAWYGKQRQQRRTDELKQKRSHAGKDDPVFGDYLNSALNEDDNSPIAENIDLSDTDTVTLSSRAQVEASHIDNTSFNDVAPVVTIKAEDNSQSQAVSDLPDGELVLAVTVLTHSDTLLSGQQIAAALAQVDMSLGDKAIYHHYLNNGHRVIAFSCANVLAPGTLSQDALMHLHTPGLVFFMQLPCIVNGLTVFDTMVDTAEKVAHHLNGYIANAEREPLTQGMLQKMRSDILTFNLTHKQDDQQFKI